MNMTKKTAAKKDDVKQEMPDGLLEVDFLMREMPKHSERILRHEIMRRERSILLLKGNLRLIKIQTWDVLKSALWTGLTVFFLILALGQVAELLRTVEGLSSFFDQVPAPIAREIELDALFESDSAVWGFATGLPEFTVLDATVVAIIAMLIVFGFKGYLIYAHFRQARQIKSMLLDTDNERRVLERWLAKSGESV